MQSASGIRRMLMAAANVVVLGAALWGADKKPAPKVAPPSAEFKAEKRAFLLKVRSKLPSDRVAALRNLADAPGREAAELIFQPALDEAPKEVQKAATEVLAGWRSQPEVPATLLDLLTKGTRKSGMDWRTAAVMKALGPLEQGDVQHQFVAYLDEFLGTPQMNQLLVHTLADELGEAPNSESLRTLMLLSKAKFFAKNFGYRRCVMQGVANLPGDDTITFMIDTLPRLKGLVQYDVVRHLMRVTGQSFGDDAAGWKVWWASQNMKLPKERPAAQSGPTYAGSGAYYGIPIGAKRVVFALDISGSMEERGKIHAAKRTLCEAIEGLTPDVFFGIVAFHGQVHVWQGELIPASEKNKKQAIQTVMTQETRNGTASYDALEASFALEPEAIYFVSDGAPRGGKISAPNEIVKEISRINRVRRVSVHAVGIGTNDPGAGKLAEFMRALADADWGEYRSVDQ